MSDPRSVDRDLSLDDLLGLHDVEAVREVFLRVRVQDLERSDGPAEKTPERQGGDEGSDGEEEGEDWHPGEEAAPEAPEVQDEMTMMGVRILRAPIMNAPDRTIHEGLRHGALRSRPRREEGEGEEEGRGVFSFASPEQVGRVATSGVSTGNWIINDVRIGNRSQLRDVVSVKVLLVRMDGELYAFFEKRWPPPARLGIARLGDPRWPFSCVDDDPERRAAQDAIVREILDAERGPPLVCNFLQRPGRPPLALPLPQEESLLLSSDRVLCAVDEASDWLVLEVGVESYVRRRVRTTTSTPFQHGTPVRPGERVRVPSSTSLVAFRPKRLLIAGDPDDWRIHGVWIGGVDQLARLGPILERPIRGGLLSPLSVPQLSHEHEHRRRVDLSLSLDVVTPALDVVLDVEYAGGAAGGAPFAALLTGEVLDDPGGAIEQRFVARWTPEGRRESWMVAETVEAAAIRHDGVVHSAPRPGRHDDVIRQMIALGLPSEAMRLENQGFVTSAGRFVDRAQGARIAVLAGQLARDGATTDLLISEDLW